MSWSNKEEGGWMWWDVRQLCCPFGEGGGMWVIGVCLCCWVWVLQMNFRVYRAYRVGDTKKGVSMGGFRVVGMGPCG